MPRSVRLEGEWWDVVASRKTPHLLAPVWLRRKGAKLLLCQLSHDRRLGWIVVVAGEVWGPRLVDGFKTRWQAISYAINVRVDLNPKEPE